MGAPSIAGLPDGGYVAVWHRQSSAYSNYEVWGQRMGADGNPVGGQFVINTYTTDSQGGANVVATADGGFVVTWHSNGEDGSAWGTYAQRFNASAEKIGGEFRVNEETAGNQYYPAIAARSDGGFVVAWENDGDIDCRVYKSSGSSDADVFDITPGDRHQTLFNTGHGADGDIVRFAVEKSDLWFSRSGNDLTVSVVGSSDAVSVADWYSDEANRVAAFQDALGGALSSGSVEALVSAMSAFAPPSSAQLSLTVEQHQLLDPIIAANWS